MSSPRDDFAISTPAHLLNSTRYQANLDERSEYLRHASVKKFGMTTMTDGATIQKHPLLNFMGACVVWPKALFLKCVDCTDHLAAGGSKDAEYVTEHMLLSLRSLPYPRGLMPPSPRDRPLQAPARLQRAGIRRRAPWSIIPIILIILIKARVNYT